MDYGAGATIVVVVTVSDVVGVAVPEVVGIEVSVLVALDVPEVVGAGVSALVALDVPEVVGVEVRVCSVSCSDSEVSVSDASDDLVSEDFVFDTPEDFVFDTSEDFVFDTSEDFVFDTPEDFVFDASEDLVFEVPLIPYFDSCFLPSAIPGSATVIGIITKTDATAAASPVRFQFTTTTPQIPRRTIVRAVQTIVSK